MKLSMTGLLLLVVLLTANLASARDCPSKLPAQLWDVTDTLSIGAELRGFYVGMKPGDGLPISASEKESWDSMFLAGLRTSLLWTPFEDWSLTWEGEARYKNPGWENRPVPGLDGRLWQLYVAYDGRPVSAAAGLQIVNFGMSSIIDQRFIAARVDYSGDLFSIGMFGGATMEFLTRNASNCLWVRYTSATTGWRTLSHDLDNFVAGAQFSYKGLRPWRAQALYLWAYPSMEHHRSHALVGNFGGPIVRKSISMDIEPALLLDHQNRVMGSVTGEVRWHIPIFSVPPLLRLAAASAFGYSASAPFAPVYENLSWGLLKRYSLFEGHLFQGRLEWNPREWVRPTVRYVAQTFNFTKEQSSDELDAGVEFKIAEPYWLLLSYVAMNVVGPHQPSHGVYFEARAVLGADTF